MKVAHSNNSWMVFLQDGGIPQCIAFQKASNGITVLGGRLTYSNEMTILPSRPNKSNLYRMMYWYNADLVLKDKIFVYDLSRNRIGWTDYDCKHDYPLFYEMTILPLRLSNFVYVVLIYKLIWYVFVFRFGWCKCLNKVQQERVHECSTVECGHFVRVYKSWSSFGAYISRVILVFFIMVTWNLVVGK